MAGFMCAISAFMVASAVAQVTQSSRGGECPSDNDPQNVVSLLQTKPQTNVLMDGVEENALASSRRGHGRQIIGGGLLYDPDHGVVVGYAARAASTLAVKLFLQSIDALTNLTEWEYSATHGVHHSSQNHLTREEHAATTDDPHYFANWLLSPRYYISGSVLCQGNVVARATNVTASLKLVANPYVRAVASFIHQMTYAISYMCPTVPNPEQPIHPMCSQLNISGAVTDSIENLMANVTFIQWLESVKKVGFGVLDVHTAPQADPLESKPGCSFDDICKLDDDLQGCLDGINAKSGANFSVAGLDQFMTQHKQTAYVCPHKAKVAFLGAEEVATLPWARLQALAGEPVTPDWYRGVAGERATELVRELYQVDFAMYKYEQ